MVNVHHFDAHDFGPVLEHLRRSGKGHDRMVGATGQNPGMRAGHQVRFRLPHNPGDRQIGHRVDGLNGLDFVQDQAETSAHIDQRDQQGRAGRPRKNQSGRIRLAADPEGMNLNARPIAGQ